MEMRARNPLDAPLFIYLSHLKLPLWLILRDFDIFESLSHNKAWKERCTVFKKEEPLEVSNWFSG